MIRIRSHRPGFRRCGIAHPAEWVEHPDDAFTPQQLKVLKAEPMLQVAVVEEPKGSKEPKEPKGAKDKGKGPADPPGPPEGDPTGKEQE